MNITEVITHPRFRQWAPGVLNSGLLLLLTASLAQWTWLFVKPTLLPVMMVPASSSGTNTNTFSVEPLLAAHLFGQASQELTGRLSNLPISSLNLVLTGVIAASNGGYALISVNDQPQEPFTVGQSVTSGAVLQAVYPDRVVIQRNGVMESLLLVGADKSAPISSDLWQPPVSAQPSAESSAVRETGSNHYIVERDHLAAQMRTPDFLRQATMVPSSSGGFQVRQMQPGSLYEKLGLRSGDIVKSVNGQPLNSVEDAMKLYQQMANLNAAQVEISRGGKSEYLYFQFSQN
jgi:general secretion pathway protein C